jgi:nitrate/TMAO reductase-like tetraheme cytochrome c subunit
MRKILELIRRLFFPPAGTPRWRRILPYAILGVLTFAAFLGGQYAWEYTNSSEFCGTACHTMPPQYSAYLSSPHARVQCVECHIGRDVFTTTFTRKAGDLRHVIFNITKTYEYPIRAHNMRPARDSCETCHFPEKFSDDSLRHIRNYSFSEDNLPQDIYLLMKTGGGTAREGLGRGIHWHIENQVLFLAKDDAQQDVSYVRVVDIEGNITEYYDISSDITAEDVAGEFLIRMDCMTCHNRITHEVPLPEDAIGQALQKGLISQDVPFIVEQSVELLRSSYPDKETAIDSMMLLEEYYLENNPDLYWRYTQEIKQAVEILQEIYTQNVFPEQKSDWYTHPNNMGHKSSPGCFRCHDGKLLTVEGEAVRLECNICHSIPVVGDPSGLTTSIELVSGPEPFSHTLTNWMTLHGKAKDNTCTACHSTPEGYENLADLVGKPPPDDSFCGNEACHANVWAHTGFNSRELEPVLEAQLYFLQNTSPFLLEGVERNYAEIFNAIFEGRCIGCHIGEEAKGGLDVSTYQGLLAGGNNGPGVVPGDLDASLIFLRQKEGDHFGQMLDDELEALAEWIMAGVP